MDDEIVKLIPKKLFTYENETLTILDDYAYYINTTLDGNTYTGATMDSGILHSWSA